LADGELVFYAKGIPLEVAYFFFATHGKTLTAGKKARIFLI